MSSPISDDKRDTPSVPDVPISVDEHTTPSSTPTTPTTSHRPPIVYTSIPAFGRSLRARFASVWTRRFVISLFAGQLLALCITCTNVTTTELVNRNWALPTTQSFFL